MTLGGCLEGVLYRLRASGNHLYLRAQRGLLKELTW
jgi:hypothetical protein